MGSALRRMQRAYRPVQNYNVEERAFKVISREKPTPAPVHPGKMKDIMEAIKRDPELLTKGKLDPKSMENMSKVFLTSQGNNPIIKARKKDLPMDRKGHEEYPYGTEEPAVIPQGKASMKQLLDLLINHQSKPRQFTADKLAAEYNLDVVDVRNVVEYFKPFQLYIPKKKEQPKLAPLKYLQTKMDDLKK